MGTGRDTWGLGGTHGDREGHMETSTYFGTTMDTIEQIGTHGER